MNLISSLKISGSSLTAQRLRMDVIASNIANAETTRTPEGGPYLRQRVVFTPITTTNAGSRSMSGGSVGQGVAVTAVLKDSNAVKSTFEPNHPDASPDGYVLSPDIEPVSEIIDLMAASRAYEASVTVMNTIKNMAQKTLDIGR